MPSAMAGMAIAAMAAGTAIVAGTARAMAIGETVVTVGIAVATVAAATAIVGHAVTAGRASYAGSSGAIMARFVVVSAADTEP